MYPPVTQFETRALRLEPRRGEPVRVVVAAGAPLARACITRLLDEHGFEVAGQAGDAEDLLRKVRAHRPDVAVTDDHRAAKVIRAELPRVAVLVLAARLEEADARELLEAGAEGLGYLLDERIAEVGRFVDAVSHVARGGSVLDPEVVAAMVRGRQSTLDALTARERDVLAQLAAGRSNRGVADALYISERAVERHITAIFGKLELTASERSHRRVLAVLAHVAAR